MSRLKTAASGSPPTPIFFNMLTIAPDAVGQGTWARTVNTSALYNALFANSTTADADEFSVNFYCPAGTYTIRFNALQSTNQGIVDIYLDGSEIDSQDLYAGSASYIYIHEITGRVLTEGEHTLRFVIDGKNGSSSDFVFSTDGVTIQRTA